MSRGLTDANRAWIATEYMRGRPGVDIAVDLHTSSANISNAIRQFIQDQLRVDPARLGIYGPERAYYAALALEKYYEVRGDPCLPPPPSDPVAEWQIWHEARGEHAWLLRAEGLSLAQIGARLDISKERARQILAKFARRVRQATRRTHFYFLEEGARP